MIWRIREMLSFQAETGPVRAHNSALASGRSIQKITAVKLDPGFGREYLQHPTAARFENFRRRLQTVAGGSFENPVMVIAASELELLILLIDPGANRGWPREIKGTALHGLQIPCGNQVLVNRCEFQGMQEQLMIQDFTAHHAGQIEVAVVREIDNRILVRRGPIRDL